MFMMHHGNIDRLRTVWIAAGFANSNATFWKDMPFMDHCFDNDGTKWSPKVSDLLVPETLGYTYRLRSVATRMTATAPQSDRFERFFAMAEGSALAPGVAVFRTVVDQSAIAVKPLSVPVTVRSDAMRKLAGRDAASAGEESLSLMARGRRGPSACGRDHPQCPGHERAHHEVSHCLKCGQPDADDPVTDPSYVGTFGFFGATDRAGQEKPSVLVDLTDAVGRLSTLGTSLPSQLNIQILPVPAGTTALAAAGTAAPAAVEVAVVSE
jgi:tyrosinase